MQLQGHRSCSSHLLPLSANVVTRIIVHDENRNRLDEDQDEWKNERMNHKWRVIHNIIAVHRNIKRIWNHESLNKKYHYWQIKFRYQDKIRILFNGLQYYSAKHHVNHYYHRGHDNPTSINKDSFHTFIINYN